MPRVRSKASRVKTVRKRALPKEAVSLTNWKCWPLVSSNETMVWPESETSFWRQQEQGRAQEPEATPPPRARVLPVAPPEIAGAIFLCKAQGKFLDKAREALERMQALAILAQQTTPDRDGCLEEFETLIAFLDKLAETEIEGVKLFHSANQIVPLEADNRLIMAGIDLNAEVFRAVLRARIGTAADASQALAALQKGLGFITINREILSANVGRLFFARNRLDEVKQNLHAA